MAKIKPKRVNLRVRPKRKPLKYNSSKKEAATQNIKKSFNEKLLFMEYKKAKPINIGATQIRENIRPFKIEASSPRC